LWDFGRLAERERPEKALAALTDLLTQESQRVDVRMEIAYLHQSARQPGSALGVLSEVTRVTSEDAPRFFTLLANAQIQLGDRAGARVTVAKLAANAKTPEDRARAEQMQRYLEQTDARPPVVARAAIDRETSPDDPGGAPRLVRPAPEAKPAALLPAPEAEGSFVEFVCLEKSFKVIVNTAQGKKGFLIPDPKQIVIVGRTGGKVDLNCGPQAPTHVKLEYTPATAGMDADGVLKILYFEP